MKWTVVKAEIVESPLFCIPSFVVNAALVVSSPSNAKPIQSSQGRRNRIAQPFRPDKGVHDRYTGPEKSLERIRYSILTALVNPW
jgi:hypothetical protein